jgi:hypothetical protein
MSKPETANVRLTPAMAEVLGCMRNGYTLGVHSGRVQLQHGKLGCGGDTLPVKRTTVEALFNRGLIAYAGYQHPWRVMVLANAR